MKFLDLNPRVIPPNNPYDYVCFELVVGDAYLIKLITNGISHRYNLKIGNDAAYNDTFVYSCVIYDRKNAQCLADQELNKLCQFRWGGSGIFLGKNLTEMKCVGHSGVSDVDPGFWISCKKIVDLVQFLEKQIPQQTMPAKSVAAQGNHKCCICGDFDEYAEPSANGNVYCYRHCQH